MVNAAGTVAPDLEVLAHDLPTDADGLLVLRTFELWAHMHDVAQATGRPVPDLDAPRMEHAREAARRIVPHDRACLEAALLQRLRLQLGMLDDRSPERPGVGDDDPDLHRS